MFSENLKKVRKAKGYTQEELAKKLNVVRQTVSKWERGLSMPDADIFSKIADILETDINVLLDGQITGNNEIARQLEKLNEQLEIKNKQRKKIRKTIFIILLVIIVFYIFLVLLNTGTSTSISNSETTKAVQTIIKGVF